MSEDSDTFDVISNENMSNMYKSKKETEHSEPPEILETENDDL